LKKLSFVCMSICIMPTIPISKVETQIWADTSESDEVIKQENSLSPMSITPDVKSDKWKKKSKNRLLELEIKTKRIDWITKDIKNIREKIFLLMKERKSLGMKLAEFKDQSVTAKSNSRTMIKNLKSELRSLEEKSKVKEMQTKELWRAIQTQDDANVKLKLDAEEWIDRESKMKEELILLRKALKNSKNKDQGDEYLYISSTTDDWKLMIESDLKRFRHCRNEPLVEPARKLNGRQQKRMMKHVAHRNFTGVKIGPKPPLKGHSVKADILTRKFSKKINVSRRCGKLANARYKKSRYQRFNKKVTAGQNIKS